MKKLPDPPREDELKFCNCAECGREMLGMSCRVLWARLPDDRRAKTLVTAGKIRGRPYCSPCLSTKFKGGGGTRDRRLPREETSPSDDNAVRALEEDR